MKKLLLLVGIIASLLTHLTSYAYDQVYQVNQADIYKGFISKKIWLDQYAMPQVSISGISYEINVTLPKGAKVSDPNKITMQMGMERKRPFVVVHVPAFVARQAGHTNQVAAFTLSISEQPQATGSRSAAKTTADVTTSVLAHGTWYKIGVITTGFYKIDNKFIATLLPKPANASISNIRIFGNGGHMLSENNAIPRPTDLIENATLLSGDGSAAIFYATGPTRWDADTARKVFGHTKNLYSDTAYYFITFDQGPGLHVQNQAPMASGNKTVTDFNYYDVYDTDMINPPQLGKLWYAVGFYPQAGTTSQTFTFDLGSPISNLYCTVSFGHTSSHPNSQISLSLNGQEIGSDVFSNCTAPGTDDVMALLTDGWNGACNSQIAKIGVNFTPDEPSAIGYLNYLEVNGRRNLAMTGDQLSFRDLLSMGAGNVANYQLQNASGNTQVWDITNPQVPVVMNGSLNGSTLNFTQDAQTLHEFAAMNGFTGQLFAPKFSSFVPNQNLHAPENVNCIIVTYPDFIDAANKLAAYHRDHDNLDVIVATTTQIYNEFSSGGQDLSAIRDFARMYYKRAGTDASKMPKYLILLGGASYDYKDRLSNNSNFVPVFESAESFNDLISFCTDDFYGFLDDSEDIENNTIVNSLDISVGRLPARSVADATSLVDKIISYTNPATLGPWRIAATVVADNNDDAGNHMDVAEAMANEITINTHDLYNIDKVYIDAIPTVSTPAGPRCPIANAAIDNDVYKGVFMINYNGHGNTQVWATERILTQDDFNNWGNKNMLPFMVTATCDFGQFDHPQYVSAAEQLVIRSGGGVIAMLTTTQAVFSTYNQSLNQQYLDGQFISSANKWNSFGDACTVGKNTTYVTTTDSGELANFRKFSLLGDPALSPNFPKYNIQVDSIVDAITMQRADTIKALGAYAINGSIHDNSGNAMTDFNGLSWVSFYDKPKTITTISGTNETFKLQDNIIYKGKATVTNGVFSLSFIAPKDLNYYYGIGKVSSYAHNGIIDAAGIDTSYNVGGYSDHPQLSSVPPLVRAYINDSLFQNGGITGSNTSLFVTLYDETGINVSGNSVGHDMIAILDDNSEVPYLLNDYYETAPNTYKYGTVNFPLNGLADGRHTIKVRAWDVNDNKGEGSVDFTVIDGTVVDIQNLKTYPNPFTNVTHFAFEHNHPDEPLNAEIEIYNTAGALVKNIKQTFTPTGSYSNEIIWDGANNGGQLLPSGVYIYRLNISTEKGFKSTAYQKLVIVR